MVTPTATDIEGGGPSSGVVDIGSAREARGDTQGQTGHYFTLNLVCPLTAGVNNAMAYEG